MQKPLPQSTRRYSYFIMVCRMKIQQNSILQTQPLEHTPYGVVAGFIGSCVSSRCVLTLTVPRRLFHILGVVPALQFRLQSTVTKFLLSRERFATDKLFLKDLCHRVHYIKICKREMILIVGAIFTVYEFPVTAHVGVLSDNILSPYQIFINIMRWKSR